MTFWQKGIVISLTSTVMTLLLVELILRFFWPQINEHDRLFQPDMEFGWSFIPNAQENVVFQGGIYQSISINAQGFRDSDFISDSLLQKIMVIGDSFATNIAVGDDQVFTEVIESRLDNFSVMNFGVNGYGSVQEFLLMKKWLPIVEPNLIIQVIYLRNDFRDNIKLDIWPYPKPIAKFNKLNEIQIIHTSKDAVNVNAEERKNCIHTFHLYHFTKSRLENINAKNENTRLQYFPPEVDICAVTLDNTISQQYEILKNILLKTHNEAQDYDVPVIFVLAPSIGQVQDESWETIQSYDPNRALKRDLPNQRLLDFAQQNDLKMLDLLPSLLQASHKGDRLYNQYEQHWTARGNTIIAETILAYLKEYGHTES